LAFLCNIADVFHNSIPQKLDEMEIEDGTDEVEIADVTLLTGFELLFEDVFEGFVDSWQRRQRSAEAVKVVCIREQCLKIFSRTYSSVLAN
jgi:hypothetical protein